MTNKTSLFDNINKFEGDTFYSKQPCVMPDQPVRHEEKRQKAKCRAKYREIYQGVRFGEVTDKQTNEMINIVSEEKVKVKSRKYE